MHMLVRSYRYINAMHQFDEYIMVQHVYTCILNGTYSLTALLDYWMLNASLDTLMGTLE